MKEQYKYYMEKPEIMRHAKYNETLASEIRNYEEENVPTEERIFKNMMSSGKECTAMHLPKIDEESEIKDI